jgi:hypothetical protein
LAFRNPPEGFLGWVDPTSEEDPYPASLWEGFAEYLAWLVADASSRVEPSGATASPYSFEGGRHGMALQLIKSNFPFLQGRCLGEICHIVQLSLRKKLMAYEGSLLVPMEAHALAVNAKLCLPTVSTFEPVVQTKEELHAIIRGLLREAPEGINLAALKAQVWLSSGMQLSTTKFGCVKLLELAELLVNDQVCALRYEPERSTYTLVSNASACSSPPGTWRTTSSSDEARAGHPRQDISGPVIFVDQLPTLGQEYPWSRSCVHERGVENIPPSFDACASYFHLGTRGPPTCGDKRAKMFSGTGGSDSLGHEPHNVLRPTTQVSSEGSGASQEPLENEEAFLWTLASQLKDVSAELTSMWGKGNQKPPMRLTEGLECCYSVPPEAPAATNIAGLTEGLECCSSSKLLSSAGRVLEASAALEGAPPKQDRYTSAQPNHDGLVLSVPPPAS